MATQIKMRRGTTSQHSSFTGSEAEVTIDTDKEVAVVHNGSTAGGFPLARADQTLALAGGTMTGDITRGGTVIKDGTITDTGDFTIDVAGDIILDADAANWRFKDAGTSILEIGAGGGGGGPSLFSAISNADMVFKGNDGGNVITALTLSMSDLGTAYFNSSIVTPDYLMHTGDLNTYIGFPAADTFRVVTAGASALEVDASGNVKIANTGGTLQTATAGTSNFRAGVNTGDAIVANTNYNVIIGDEAGTDLNSGDRNVAVGYKAFFEATSAEGNVAIGQNAMRDTSTGTFNVAVGNSAMGDGIVTGGHNIALGYLPLENLTGGIGNIALGREALEALTTGNNNIAIGQFALEAQNGSEVVAVGGDSGFSFTSTDSVFVGFSAGQFATSGAGQTFVGHSAGKGITGTKLTGTNNTAIGRDSGLVLQGNAYSNTFLGANSGKAVTTGVQNTFAGDGAGDAFNDADNNVAIGAFALSTETNNNGNTAVGAEALGNQNVGGAGDARNSALGFQAGAAVTDGQRNTLIGGLAGGSLTEGDFNVALGYLAADHSVDLTTGSSNTIIGAFCHTSAAASTQQIVMGHDVTGNADNSFCFGNQNTDSAIAFGATSISAPSDERYKEDIADATAGLSFIKDLRPVTFKWKKEKDLPTNHRAYVEDSEERVMLSSGETNHGFIAQEVKAVIDNHSEIQDGFAMWNQEENDTNDGRQRLADGALIPILVKAIQELEARIATLEG